MISVYTCTYIFMLDVRRRQNPRLSWLVGRVDRATPRHEHPHIHSIFINTFIMLYMMGQWVRVVLYATLIIEIMINTFYVKMSFTSLASLPNGLLSLGRQAKSKLRMCASGCAVQGSVSFWVWTQFSRCPNNNVNGCCGHAVSSCSRSSTVFWWNHYTTWARMHTTKRLWHAFPSVVVPISGCDVKRKHALRTPEVGFMKNYLIL